MIGSGVDEMSAEIGVRIKGGGGDDSSISEGGVISFLFICSSIWEPASPKERGRSFAA